MSEKVYQDSTLALYHGDCLEVMRVIPDNSVDSITTDPPYGLGLMGKSWDALPPGEDWARECLRVLKPGGHLLAFGGTRTWHRLAVAVEDAGFELRDSIAWHYSTGFPKSYDVGKKLPEWEGWGTALKPAFEPIVMGRKPLSEKTVAANVLEHGTGALNIDACRIETSDTWSGTRRTALGLMNDDGWKPKDTDMSSHPGGRWPANVVFDESQADVLDQQASASRFFYVAKASKKERPVVDGVAHPTVKPVAIMQWLVKLVTPAGGIVLDPFEGSGTTAQACALEGFKHIGIEREADYLPLIAARLNITLDQLQPA